MSTVMLVLFLNGFVPSFVTSAYANTTATSYTTIIQRSYYLSKDTPSSIAAAVLAGVSVVLLALLLYQTRQTSRQLQFITTSLQQQQLQQQRCQDEEEQEQFVISTNPLSVSTDGNDDHSVSLTSRTIKQGTGTE